MVEENVKRNKKLGLEKMEPRQRVRKGRRLEVRCRRLKKEERHTGKRK
jgi:hypothetical protein